MLTILANFFFKLRCPKYSNAASCENCKCTHKMPSLAFSIRCFNKLNFYHMNLYLSTEFVFSLHITVNMVCTPLLALTSYLIYNMSYLIERLSILLTYLHRCRWLSRGREARPHPGVQCTGC